MASFTPQQYFHTDACPPFNHTHPTHSDVEANMLAQAYYRIARLETELEHTRNECDDAERINKWLLKKLVDETIVDKRGTKSGRISAATTVQGSDCAHQTVHDHAHGRSASSASAGAEPGSSFQTRNEEILNKPPPSRRNPKFDYLDFLPSDDDADDEGQTRKETKKEDQRPLDVEQPEQTKVPSGTAPIIPRAMRWGRHIDEEIAQMAATKSAPPAVPQFGAIDISALTQASQAPVRSVCASPKTDPDAEAIPVKPDSPINNIKVGATEKNEERIIQKVEGTMELISSQIIKVERRETDDAAPYLWNSSESDSAEEGDLCEAAHMKDEVQTGKIKEQGPQKRVAPNISASEHFPALHYGGSRFATDTSRSSFFSAVLVSNLPIDTSNRDVLSHIRGGCIVSVQIDSLSVCNGTKEVNVIFLGPHTARDVVEYAQTRPLTIGDRTATVTLIEEQVWLPTPIFHLARSGATRILRLKYLHPDITNPEWILGTIYQGPPPASPDEEITFIGPVEGGRVMEIHFTGIEEAESARVKLEGAKFKVGGEQRQDRFYVVEWGRDPCEANVGGGEDDPNTESEGGDLDHPDDEKEKMGMSTEDMADLY